MLASETLINDAEDPFSNPLQRQFSDMDPPTESRLYGQKKFSPKSSLILIEQEMNMKEKRPEQRKNIVRNVLVMNSKLL